MNQITNQSNSVALILLKLVPLFGISLLSLIFALNALSGTAIFLSVLLVSIICSILIIWENMAEEDISSLVIQFFIMLNVWFITYPIYFLQKEGREKKGNFALIASAMTFIMIIGFGELHRFSNLKTANEHLSHLINLILLALFTILMYSAPIIFANIFNSIKKSRAIIFALISFALVFVPLLLDVSGYKLFLVSIISLIIYIYALRFAFDRASE